MSSISKTLKPAFQKALLGSFLYIIIFLFSNINFIKTSLEDRSFDSLNKRLISHSPVKLNNAPNVIVLGIDDKYLQDNQMMDKKDFTNNFGYMFPRNKLSNIIQELDLISSINRPKALFIDYDFTYFSLVNNQTPSKEDLEFLNVLKQKRNYIIVLPKTNKYNFIESSNDPKIQELIKNKKLIFVSTGFAVSGDHASRRFFPYEELYNSQNLKLKKYEHATLALWQLSINNRVDIKAITENFKNQDVVENRIIFKAYKESSEKYIKYSNWENLTYFSASIHIDEIIEEKFKDSIIMVGATYRSSPDVFNINTMSKDNFLYGIELHAQTLMTHFYLNGGLNYFNIWISLVIIFILIFVIEVICSTFCEFTSFKLSMLSNLLVSIFMMYMASYLIFIYYHYWFNWAIPLLLGQFSKFYWLLKKEILERTFNYKLFEKKDTGDLTEEEGW